MSLACNEQAGIPIWSFNTWQTNTNPRWPPKNSKWPPKGPNVEIFLLKGVLHPDTKISMFCLFSPSSRRKSILFMYSCDRCVWFKVKKHDIFSMDLRISHVEWFKIFFFLFNLKNHFKINRINSCFYYSWNHPFSLQKYIPMLKSSFTWLDLAIWSWPLFTIGDSNAPEITQNMYFFNIG